MNKKEFKKKLKERTSCSIQHNGWTCGTCFFSISKKLTNDHWRAVLYFRGDYTKEEIEADESWEYNKEKIDKWIKEVWELIK